jgi:hypothetical protein
MQLEIEFDCFKDTLKSEYYEEPLLNPITSIDIEDCKTMCFRNYSCIRFIYFPSSADDLDVESNTCYLRTSYHILNGYPQQIGTQMFGVKSKSSWLKLIKFPSL